MKRILTATALAFGIGLFAGLIVGAAGMNASWLRLCDPTASTDPRAPYLCERVD